MKTIGNMESNIGPDATKQVLDKALSSGNTGKELHDNAESLYQEEKKRQEDIKNKPGNNGEKNLNKYPIKASKWVLFDRNIDFPK